MGTIHVSQSWTKEDYDKCLSDEQTELLTTPPSGVVSLDAFAECIGGVKALRASCASGACACLSSACCGGGDIQIDTIPAGVLDLDRMVKLVGGREGVVSTCGSKGFACDCFSTSCCGGALLA